MSDRNYERSSPRECRGSGASPFADFSSFREMIREEREAARAGREAASAAARVERETAAAEKRRLMAEVIELKLQLAEEIRRRPGVARGEPSTTGSRGEPRGLIESTAAGGDRITNLVGGTAIGVDGRMYIEPMCGWEASLLQALHVREPQ